MARPKQDPPIYDQVEAVIAKLTDTQELTWDELFDVAEKWCRKDYEHHQVVAAEHGLVPIALLLAALLHVDHPLLISPSRGIMFGFLRCTAEIIMVEIEMRDVEIPVRKTVARPVPVQPRRIKSTKQSISVDLMN